MKKPTKAHIICHLLATRGPMTKAELLQETARIEGKPYRPGSNISYFVPYNDLSGAYYMPSKSAMNGSLVYNGSITPAGKRGNSLLYVNTAKGMAKAAEYSDWLALQA